MQTRLQTNAQLALLVPGLATTGLAIGLAYLERKKLAGWFERLGEFFTPETPPSGNVFRRLLLASVAAFYVEITLIRWISTEVRIFAYFQNLALVACFLGFGLGCYWSAQQKSLFWSVAAMAAMVALAEAPISIWKNFLAMNSSLLSLSADAALWGIWGALPFTQMLLMFAASVVVVACFLFLLVAAMIPLGQYVGHCLDRASSALSAYSVNLLGSVVGVWIPASLAFLWIPPVYWFSLAFLLVLVIHRPSRPLLIASLLLWIFVSILLWKPSSDLDRNYWSPYQKLEVVWLGGQEYLIQVNNTGYMTIADLTPQALGHNAAIARRYREESPYDAPFHFAPRCDRVLIVGAGAGNDTAGALRSGAGRIDAVEIDPVIYHIGESLHPEHPYSSPKVRVILDDARAFLRRTQEKYDVILFGLLDSHTQFSDLSNLRIDNYVFTEEAFREAMRLLKPDGILILKFEVRAPWNWIGQRFFAMLSSIFGRPPVTFFAQGVGNLTSATVFISSQSPDLRTRAAQPQLALLIARHPPNYLLTSAGAPPPTTDDWPYVYHRDHSIPSTYLTVGLILLAMTVFFVRGVLDLRNAGTWQFSLLGAGFLLLETQMISRLALYFGSTWLVNCVALTAILLTLVAANLYVARFRPSRLAPYYLLLVATLLTVYVVRWHQLPYTARAVGTLLSVAFSLPVFFSGIIFTETFLRSMHRSSAFGANIVGAVAGGLAHNLSFIVGMKALLLITALLYSCAGALSYRRGGGVLQKS